MSIKIGVFVPSLAIVREKYGVARYIRGIVSGLENSGSCEVQYVTFDLAGHSDTEFFGRSKITKVSRSLFFDANYRFGFPTYKLNISDVDFVVSPLPLGIRCSQPLATCIYDPEPFEKGLPWHKSLGLASKLKSWMRYRSTLANSDMILTISEFSKSGILKAFPTFPAERVVNTYCGVSIECDDEIVTKDEELVFQRMVSDLGGESFFIQLGGLTQKKGGELLLAIAEKCQSSGFRILVIGGNHDYALMTRAKALHNVHFAGYVSDCILGRLYQHATALLFTSLYEGFGLPLVEAMSHGLPVICNRCAAIPEVVGEAGIVLKPTDVDQWVSEMRSLVSDAVYRSARCHASILRARDFNWSDSASCLLVGLEQFLKVSGKLRRHGPTDN